MIIGKGLKDAIANVDIYIENLLESLENSDKYHSVDIVDENFLSVSRYKSSKCKDVMPAQKVKIGRFFRSVLSESILDDSDVEYLSNKVLAYSKALAGSHDLLILKGEDIKIAYNENNYLERVGSLGNSCMRFDSKSSFLDLYSKNESCSVLVNMVDDKITSRALVWTLDDGSKFVDRVYSIYDYMPGVYEEYAKKNKYGFHNKNGFNLLIDGKYTKRLEVGPISIVNMPEKFPYLDTFHVLYIDKLYSYAPECIDEVYNYLSLRSTTGGSSVNNLPIPLQRGISESYRSNLSRERTDWLSNMSKFSSDDIQYLFNLAQASFITLKSIVEKIINTDSEFPNSRAELDAILLKDVVGKFKLGLYKSVNKEYPEHFYNVDGSVKNDLVQEYKSDRRRDGGLNGRTYNTLDFLTNFTGEQIFNNSIRFSSTTGEIDLSEVTSEGVERAEPGEDWDWDEPNVDLSDDDDLYIPISNSNLGSELSDNNIEPIDRDITYGNLISRIRRRISNR